MHGAALPSAATCALGKKLGHQKPHWYASSHGVFVRPVRASQHVALLKGLTHSNSTGFLTLCLVNRAWHPALQEEGIYAVFEHPAEQHLSVDGQPLFVCRERLVHREFR